ncbi:DUF4435 domain-containing protein [Deinococcus sedimenti]|uniref:DUF4435 domain-containing protein n=1 Tax=Deinococcus sedimenti TaxID=1867090 RepID=A0ABQ2S4J9_9DEIO|nr:DUF4435 domain-containing protein [Deinococcus sedimenti]GGR97237.1 hypothetical protein GCM10008960_25040 [Deinococcus sedimenti]
MSNLLDRLKEARSSTVTVIDRFIREYGRHGAGAYIFVEGKNDRLYYQSIVKRIINKKHYIKIFVCGNRKAVIEAEKNLRDRRLPNGVKTLFFADRDFDYNLQNEPHSRGVCYTDGYSFENYLIDGENMRLAWDSCVTTATSGLDYDILSRIFKREYIKFARIMIDLSAHVLARRRYIREGEKIVLNDARILRFMNIDSDLNIEYEENILPKISDQIGLRMMKCDAKVFKNIKRDLREKGSLYYIRGKYLTTFIQKFLEGVQVLGKSVDANFAFDVQINERNIVNYILMRGNIPNNLASYVEARLV